MMNVVVGISRGGWRCRKKFQHGRGTCRNSFLLPGCNLEKKPVPVELSSSRIPCPGAFSLLFQECDERGAVVIAMVPTRKNPEWPVVLTRE